MWRITRLYRNYIAPKTQLFENISSNVVYATISLASGIAIGGWIEYYLIKRHRLN